jgi:hypothetical protein
MFVSILMALVVVAALLSVPVLGVLLVARLLRVVRTGALFGKRRGGAWAEGAGWFLGGAALVYGLGMAAVVGHAAPDWCPVQVAADAPDPSDRYPHPRLESSLFPLVSRCVSDVRPRVGMVPAVINPAVVLCLAGAVVCAVVAACVAGSDRRGGAGRTPWEGGDAA